MHIGRGSITLALVAAAGCSTVGTATLEGSVQTGGGSVALSFVSGLGGTRPDIATISGNRGTVDLVTADGGWQMFGSFYAGGVAVDVTSGRLGSRGVIAVLDTDGSVALLNSIDGMAHRLAFPIIAYRRVRNGQPVDGTPPARGMALGDLDGDGNDELIVGSDLGVAIVTDLTMFITANPERPPPGNGFRYDAGPMPGAVAVLDFDGDGKKDILAVDQQEPSLRIYHNAGGADQIAAPATVTLPATGVAIVASGCPNAPAVVLLSDGRLVRIGKDGTASPAAPELTPITRAASGPSQVAVGTKASANGLAIYDACAASAELVRTSADDQAGIALAPGADTSQQELALLGSDGKTVTVYALAGY